MIFLIVMLKIFSKFPYCHVNHRLLFSRNIANRILSNKRPSHPLQNSFFAQFGRNSVARWISLFTVVLAAYFKHYLDPVRRSSVPPDMNIRAKRSDENWNLPKRSLGGRTKKPRRRKYFGDSSTPDFDNF